jgi:hypothetical protein
MDREGLHIKTGALPIHAYALSEELGVHRRLLYKWRDQLEPIVDIPGCNPSAVL